MGAPNFNAPGVLFVGSWGQDERRFLTELCRSVATRYPIYHEPCVGVFAVTQMALEAGFTPTSMTTSDVGLLQSVLGLAITGGDLNALNVRLDGQPLELSGDPVGDAALIAYEQMLARYAVKAEKTVYWAELLRDAQYRREPMLEELRGQVRGIRDRLVGLTYEPLDIFAHLERAKHDHRAVIVMNPPTYKAGYEKFYDTGGRLTWDEPAYELFTPDESLPKLHDRASDAKALCLIYQECEPGRALEEPLWVRRIGKDRCAYVWANRPEEMDELMSKRVHAGIDELIEPLPGRTIMPFDYLPSETSTVAFEVVPARSAQYYRQLWIHKVAGTRAQGLSYAIYVDGYLAGVGSIDTAPILNIRSSGKHAGSDNLLLTYCASSPSKYTLTKLIVMLTLTRACIERTVHPAFQALANNVVTTEYSRYPEQKGLRGIMKLTKREPDANGFKLIYSGKITDEPPRQVVACWLKRERSRGVIPA